MTPMRAETLSSTLNSEKTWKKKITATKVTSVKMRYQNDIPESFHTIFTEDEIL